jgi:hypothetical protein
LTFSLGTVNPSNDRMIVFYMKKVEPQVPPSISFQLLVMIKNIVIPQYIIDEGASKFLMFSHIWKKLGSPELIPSMITLYAYDGHPS